jgi:hypothetical protein
VDKLGSLKQKPREGATVHIPRHLRDLLCCCSHPHHHPSHQPAVLPWMYRTCPFTPPTSAGPDPLFGQPLSSRPFSDAAVPIPWTGRVPRFRRSPHYLSSWPAHFLFVSLLPPTPKTSASSIEYRLFCTLRPALELSTTHHHSTIISNNAITIISNPSSHLPLGIFPPPRSLVWSRGCASQPDEIHQLHSNRRAHRKICVCVHATQTCRPRDLLGSMTSVRHLSDHASTH